MCVRLDLNREDASVTLQPKSSRPWLWIPVITTLLSLAAYAWALALPFIADVYLQITVPNRGEVPWFTRHCR